MGQLFRLPFLALVTLALTLSALVPVTAVASAEQLKLIVYGATGRVGSRVVDEALGRGHRVTAVSRDPARIETRHENLKPVKGDVLDAASVARLIGGHDVVVVAVRGAVDKSKEPEKTVHRMAVEVIVEVMREMGPSAPRLIFSGGAGSLEIEPGVLYADELPFFLPGFVKQEIKGHLLVLEYLRGIDDVRWTYVSPPKKFKPGKRTGKYRLGGDKMLKDKKGKSRISMEDFAIALVDEAENGKYIGQRFSVAW